ncbi:hypothetical protein Aperf_G00000043423 [Anoplocephala perfoliata]
MGQNFGKLCDRSFCPSLRLFGIHHPPYHPLQRSLSDRLSDSFSSSSSSPRASSLNPDYFEYLFLCDPEVGKWLVSTRFMLILRGLPGSGKSCLANHIKMLYPAAYICHADNYNSSLNNSLYGNDQDETLRACEAEVRDCSLKSISPIIIDTNNIRSYECRLYTEIARSFDYSVIIVTPMTPWRFDTKYLAANSVHCVSTETIGSMISNFEPTIYPLYYGWFFAGSQSCNDSITLDCSSCDAIHPSKEAEQVIQHCYATYLSMLEIPYVRQRLALMCNFDSEIDRDQLAKFWSSAVNPPFGQPSEYTKVSRPHCTAFFSKFGRATGAVEYANRSSVRESLLGVIHSLCLVGLFITKRTVGLRVRFDLSDQLKLWGGSDDEAVDGYIPDQSRPRGCRAHVTLALAPGIPALETGFDVLRIVDAELSHRPDITRIEMIEGVMREIPVSMGSETIFYYQYNTPLTVRLMYSAFY